jgi:hydrogenase maturation protease
MTRPGTIVIGIGSWMRGDDGFGGAVVEALLAHPEADALRAGGAQMVWCDGEPGRLIGLWEDFEHAIMVDAARGGTEPVGFVHRRELPERDGGSAHSPAAAPPLAAMASEPRGNGHAAGLGAAVRLAEALGRLPRRLTLYAVHGRDFTLGAQLSPPVAAAVPKLAERIAREIAAELRAARPRAEGPVPVGTGGPEQGRAVRATVPL